ncbi:hypothetical protein PFISCL1PPCAC_13121 [Pristionchus fissidentatus]|uniref:Nuclear receptor n=1 Tax=Pristionchus fissidentatus TaxID=1538716 RepID=A0AAV5VTV9_9BILA|nr:hypothetical protein PFISCL1PPCAC_13121 [Pristionchus fissidentatus]
MPRPKTEKTERRCLVCGGTTQVAHLGLDICRACTVFYRRSRDRKYACRSNSNNCPIGDGVNCRKCRLREMERMLAAHPHKTKLPVVVAPVVIEKQEPITELDAGDHALMSSPSTSITSPPECSAAWNTGTQFQRPLLAKLQLCYRSLCETRLTAEMALRKEPPSPLAVVDGDFAVLPATYLTMESSNKVFLTALLHFGAAAFPEFAAFTSEDRWTVVTNYFNRFRQFEGAYRSDKKFDDLNRVFAGYTMYFCPEIVEHFWDDCPNDVANLPEAKRIMEAKFKRDLRVSRVGLRRANLHHEEFLALLALMFWATEGLNVSDEVTRTSQQYREAILKELHNFFRFRDEQKMDDYAARLGELLMFLQVYEQKSVALDQHFEVMRLLNVFSDDTVVYRITGES